ncbi:hypothetical protein [Streptomyces celluloflavus]|uniref:hypothetical protein n=1 Tax=Streptomyces celluloflavus TaxID=58344 RepID=UPI00365162AA
MTNVVQVTHAQIPAWRLRRQSLAPHTTAAPEELAERLAGVQAQVPSAAEPALATRRTEPAAGAVRVAGSVVGTWGLRGTLHLLAARRAAANRTAGWISPVVHGGRVAEVWEFTDEAVAVTLFAEHGAVLRAGLAAGAAQSARGTGRGRVLRVRTECCDGRRTCRKCWSGPLSDPGGRLGA